MSIAELTPIEAKARIIAQGCDVTGNRWEVLKDFYRLPQDVTGLKIADICAGESDLTAVLSSLGADAVAVDMGYANPDLLRGRRVQTFKNSLIRSGLSPESVSHIPPTEFEKATQRFARSLRENPEKYVHASALALPFGDNQFDFVLSFFGIVGVFEEDMQVLRRAINEAIRVVKPGGQVQIGPAADGTQTYQGRINTGRLVTELMARSSEVAVSSEFFDFYGSGAQRITVTKK